MGADVSILALVTTDKSRYLGGDPLAFLVKDEEEMQELTFSLARALMADVVQLRTGECLVIKR